MTLPGFVQTIKVDDFRPGTPPIDISEAVQKVSPNAIGRMLTRIEVYKPDGNQPAPTPQFFSIAKKCTHEGCNLLKPSTKWKPADPKQTVPIVYSMLGADGVGYAVIQCPCHGSRFDLTTGERLLGPAPPGRLSRFDVKIEPVNDELYVFVAIDPTPQETPTQA